jgi:hypothetical protein
VPLLAIISACHEPEPYHGDACGREDQRLVPIWQKPALDVLVVLDRSSSMADHAADLQRYARTTEAVLTTVEGGVPDLHLAVVTSDLGAGGVAGCDAGDAGAFYAPACCGLDGNFLRARGLVEGGVGGNFSGTLLSTLACLFEPPVTTCPVSQPLGAAVQALEGNPDFRRDYALLLVLVVTDGDDCTLATANALADVTAANDLEGAVEFACFARGASCTPADPSTPGAHTGCTPRTDAGIADVGALVAQLQTFVDDPKMLVISTVAPTADPFVLAGGRLGDSCGGSVVASAAPRLESVFLPDRTSLVDVCGDWTDSVIWIAESIRVPLANFCLSPEIDLDPATQGYQTNCATRLVDENGATVAPLPFCDAAGVDRSRPCLEPFIADPQQCPEGGPSVGWSLGDERLPDGARVELRCEIACE